ncbi:MAG: PilW family protein [Pseudomonadota bacterium]|jgi:type IV pilus assembly protein PilW|nr:PilW family protein [Xanthomonadaceae bacterium]MDE2248023.1 PilW family protein [Xanthomonadaceae bacterium]MDE3209500.1 PilW family protein [Pseudomonadota bacterium]
MIAMLLGLIVISGVVSVFLAGQQSYRTNVALGDVQDGSRIAFEMMARDIRGAGLTGCTNNGRVSNVLLAAPVNGGSSWWADFGNAVRGYTATSTATDPALTVGTGATNQVANTDSIQLIGAADSGLSVAKDPEPSAGFKINAITTDLSIGDVMIACDPDHTAIFQITGTSSSNVQINHDQSSGSHSGNCTKGLGYPPICTAVGNTYSFGANSQIARLAADDWYIGNYVDSSSGAKGTSLYRLSLANIGGTPTATAQEMVRNVSGMSILYHQSSATSFVGAALVTDWSTVDAVRVTLNVQSSDQRAGTDVKPLLRTFVATTTVRNRVK